MILIVFGLEAMLYHSVFTTYLRIVQRSESLGYRFLGVLVIASYTVLVCIQPSAYRCSCDVCRVAMPELCRGVHTARVDQESFYYGTIDFLSHYRMLHMVLSVLHCPSCTVVVRVSGLLFQLHSRDNVWSSAVLHVDMVIPRHSYDKPRLRSKWLASIPNFSGVIRVGCRASVLCICDSFSYRCYVLHDDIQVCIKCYSGLLQPEGRTGESTTETSIESLTTSTSI